MEQVMQVLKMCAAGLIATVVLAMAGPATAQPLKDQLVGSWSTVSNTEEYADGNKTPWGPDVKGTLLFEANGQFALEIGVGERAKPAGNPAENPVGKFIAYFGSYDVDEASKTISFKIVRSSFPGWDGTEQKRVVTEIGDQMTFKSGAPIPSGKGPFTPVVVWSRVK
jgi:hypothetical protein